MSASSMPLRLRGLVKRYGGVNVIDGLDLEVPAGVCYGLLGPNGAGKTTTLRLTLGLVAPDAGEIELLGHRLPQEATLARAQVGVLPQFDSLDPDFTVAENLYAYGRYFGLGRRELAARVPDLLALFGLASKADALVPSLSGGMKRRLALARALINDPAFVLLDEPTTGLDPQARHLVWQSLRRLTARGKTLLLTTHFMEEAERLCAHVYILDHGHIIAAGAPRELIRAHVEPHVVEVYGEALDDWAAHAASGARRAERVGETLFCYLDDPAPLIATIERIPGLRYLQRAANLEDVFLKLTGRDLRD